MIYLVKAERVDNIFRVKGVRGSRARGIATQPVACDRVKNM